ncbi:hypothetical protein DSO57_1026387 [Entomophthora muscae]|uniref:Uncharacterized protein n=1 Tax=Entomophthora muscae TaxID=34485 RepID=A0ACC2SR28_9FUNG|nr:hypothetical protein DSO57_1026387 [Entomophthora muscae]
MTDKLPPNLLKFFAPRPPIPYLPPLDRHELQRTGPVIGGLAQFAHFVGQHDIDYKPTESLEERRARKIREREEKHKQLLADAGDKWNPNEDPEISGDPFKTLIIARLNYAVTESELKRELELYGPIKRVRIVKNKKTGNPTGYAFVEYEREKDMKAAYHEADASKIKGRRVVVDVERGRSVKGWLPRRLGGGLGFTRKGGEKENQQHSGREASSRHRGESESSRHRDHGRIGGDRGRDRRRSRSPVTYGRRDRDERPRERDDRYRDRGYDRSYGRDYDRHRERDHDRPRDFDRPREYDYSRR